MSTGNTSSADAPHAHHFASAEHEYVSSKLGIWLFLATEVLMFGALLVAYVLYHGQYPDVFVEGSKALSWKYGAVNTAVLLFSSFTMAISIYHLQNGNPGKARLNLLLTLLCGFIFLGIKYVEYSHKIHLGLLPGSWFHGDLKGIPKLPLYYSFYYMMTGLHGIHVCIGMALIFWVFLRTGRGDFGPKKFTAVEGVGLFWHLIDLVWIFLFPLLYLVEGANS